MSLYGYSARDHCCHLADDFGESLPGFTTRGAMWFQMIGICIDLKDLYLGQWTYDYMGFNIFGYDVLLLLKMLT